MADMSGKDLAYRAVAAVLGGPVDLTTMVMRPFGYNVEKPVLGSEWIGQKIQDTGLISEARDPLKEFVASLLVPGGGVEAVVPMIAKGAAAGAASLGGLYAMHKAAGTVDQASSLARMGEATRQSGVIKGKGGNWLKDSVEDAVWPLKRREPNNIPEGFTAEQYANRYGPTSAKQFERRGVINTWIDKQLTKYVKNEMATPGDPVRALAERGISHVDPESLARGTRQVHVSGEHLDKLGVSEGAKRWENASDAVIYPEQARTFKASVNGATGRPTIERNPWLEKVPDDAPVYSLTPDPANLDGLGFRHLTDELHNALRPDSGLPKNLQLNPVSLNRMGVPQAVEHVAKINKWREEQKVASNLKIANNPATHLFKEYPTVPGHGGGGQANTRGLKWVEVKQPEPKTFEELTPKQQEWYQDYVNEGVSPEGALRNAAKRDPQHLKDALKYEGDTMGHCVGGYCEDVASGKSKIYSLRDAKGRPHVTVEVEPGRLSGKTSLADWAASYERTHGAGSSPAFLAEHPEIAQAFEPTVKQIKGKGNKAPKDEYVPFVQDFIRSQKFSDIGDLANAQMYRASNTFNKAELAYLEGHGAKLSGEEYLTKAEVDALQSLFKSK